MAARKPAVEFYDLAADPHEVRNLAGDPKHGRLVEKYAGLLDRWMRETGDRGGEPEEAAAKAL